MPYVRAKRATTAGRYSRASLWPKSEVSSLFVSSLSEANSDGLTRVLTYELAQFGFDWQLVGTVTESHERCLKWVPVGGALYLYESARVEVLG